MAQLVFCRVVFDFFTDITLEIQEMIQDTLHKNSNSLLPPNICNISTKYYISLTMLNNYNYMIY